VSESSPSASAFSAAGPALGYLAQVDYALLAALERMDDEDDFAVSIDTLDDIVFHDAESDDATAKWQSKHTIDQTRSLSDASTDLWKTLANWIAEPGEAHTRLVLLAVASAGPTAALLRVGGDRDVVGAQQRLERTAHTSASDSNAGYYAAFLALSTDQRRAPLVSHRGLRWRATHRGGAVAARARRPQERQAATPRGSCGPASRLVA